MRWRDTIPFLLFAATIPAANWLIGNVGSVCVPSGPCLIPVGFGLMAPSGVLLVGLALVLRDWINERHGAAGVLAALGVGAVLSALFAQPALLVASVAAFVLAELADYGVYRPLRERGLALAVMASGVVGAVVDSAVFLLIAFGSLDYMGGQFVGKMWASAIAAAGLHAVFVVRRRQEPRPC